jgi:hypothetical protein
VATFGLRVVFTGVFQPHRNLPPQCFCKNQAKFQNFNQKSNQKTAIFSSTWRTVLNKHLFNKKLFTVLNK